MTRTSTFFILLVFTGLASLTVADDHPMPTLPNRAAGDLAIKDPRVESVIQPAPLRKHVEYLASPELEGRGSPKSRQLAAKYLVQEFKRLDLKPLWGDHYVQEVPGIRDANGIQPIWGLNVGAMLVGSDPQLKDEIIVLGVHYDHLGIRDGKLYPGADDNASSVAMLIEVARQLATAKERPRRSIAFVGFDLEEHLLWGSRWFAAHPPWPLAQIKLFITSDLLGRTLGDLPFPAVFVMGSERGTGMSALIKEMTPPLGLELARLGADVVGTRSDYGPFRDEKVPFLFFSTGEHPDYHTPQDTADKLNYPQLASISNVVLHVLQQTANTANAPTWIESPVPDLAEAQTIHRITELLQQADRQGDHKLTGVQSYIVTQAHNKTSQILKKGEITKDDRVWLIRSAQALLYSVF
jgi:hypothetical protein